MKIARRLQIGTGREHHAGSQHHLFELLGSAGRLFDHHALGGILVGENEYVTFHPLAASKVRTSVVMCWRKDNRRTTLLHFVDVVRKVVRSQSQDA